MQVCASASLERHTDGTASGNACKPYSGDIRRCGERERTLSPRQLELDTLLPDYAARLTRKGVTVKSLFENVEKTFGLDRLVAACACASQMHFYGYQDVTGILNRGDD